MTPQIKQRIEQIQRGEVPNGYKKTNVGIVPREWNLYKLSEISTELHERVGNGNYETLSISAGIGFVNQANKFGKEISGAQYSKYTVLNKGDFSYNKGNSKKYPQGCIYQLKDRKTAAVPNVFESFRLTKGCNDYFEQLFMHGFLNSQLFSKINHGVRDDGLLNLRGDDFYSLYIVFPSIAEQEKIAEILSTQDKLILLKEKLIVEKKRQKKYLMQQFLTGNKRLAGFNGEWVDMKLGDLCSITTGKLDANAACPSGKYMFFTCSRENFQINDFEFDGDAILIAGNGDVGHTKVYSGKFNAYQRTYVLMNFKINYYLLKEYIDNTLMPVVYKELQGGAMPYIKLSTLQNLNFYMPTAYSEIEKLTSLFADINFEIELLQKELDQEKQKKKALMQLLLTGIVRV